MIIFFLFIHWFISNHYFYAILVFNVLIIIYLILAHQQNNKQFIVFTIYVKFCISYLLFTHLTFMVS